MTDSAHRALRVLSYNMHKGFSVASRRLVLEEMRTALRGVSADLVFLQEIIGRHDRHAERHSRWPKETQLEYLADRLWPHTAYGRNAVYQAGHHGNAFLSRYQILSAYNQDVSTNRFEYRGILHASIALPANKAPLHCCCVHLNILQRGRTKQLQRLVRLVNDHVPAGAPLIVAGDFNDWRGRASAVLRQELGLEEVFETVRGMHAPTFPAMLPLFNLDRIYQRGFSVRTIEVLGGAEWERLSDHAPVLAELLPAS